MIFMCLLLAGTALHASGKLPEGRWIVQQVTVEKTVDGNTETTVYNAAKDVQSFYSCPKEFIINRQNLTIRYLGDTEEIAEYSLEDNRLTIFAAVAKLSYLYSASEGNLIFTTTRNYFNNLPTGQVEQISEKWTIVLNK